ncbi:MAG: 16S rRNA (guanine(527)-N(7))-methyltransferase RsmG [Candidatus Limnocylindria bacterium]
MAQTDGAAAARASRLALEGLLTDAPDLAASLPPGTLDRLERYVALLLEANRRLNLTRVVEPSAVARLHLLDALAALPLIGEKGTGLDLGSGGGVPGIPLALARPAMGWTLVDSVGRKADALRAFVQALGLANVEVLADRAEMLGQSPVHRERYDLVVARACAPLPVLAELALPLLRVGGRLVAWKGPLTKDSEEVRRGRAAIGQLGGGLLRIHSSRLSLGGHTLVEVPKELTTPARYPRRPGEPARRPLG